MNEAREIRLTDEQALAVEAVLDFIADPAPPSPFFVLSGGAGCGKTFCMREVVSRCKHSKVKLAFTAPTNKAAKVLRSIVGEAGTIYSLLGLRIDKSGELKQLVSSKAPIDLSHLDVIFIDEASMVNRHLFSLLEGKAVSHGLKIVFMGDRAQLPPVGEPQSPIWAHKLPSVNLTKVMRHDNQILTLATHIRLQSESLTPSVNLANDNSDGQGVWKMTKLAFKKDIYEAACAGAFADGSQAKVVAWRNVKVAEYNNLIRSAIFGGAAIEGEYLVGDRVVATAPCMKGEDILLATDDEAIVEGVLTCLHPLDIRYTVSELQCRTEANKVIRLLVLHPSSAEKFKSDSEKLAFEAKANGKLWKRFWDHKELFHEVKYAYALTAHRAQGSTYENVWVDYQDVLLNRNRKEAFQCLYVACTRPSLRLRLA